MYRGETHTARMPGNVLKEHTVTICVSCFALFPHIVYFVYIYVPVAENQ